MAFRETNPSLVNRMNQISIDNKRSGTPLKVQAPALKAVHRKNGGVAPNNASRVPRTVAFSAAKPREQSIIESLTPQWHNGINEFEKQSLVSSRDSGNLFTTGHNPQFQRSPDLHSPGLLTPEMLRSHSITTPSPLSVESEYTESLLPSFLFEQDSPGSRDDNSVGDAHFFADSPSNPCIAPNPSNYAVSAPPPVKLQGKTPSGLFTLQSLGPLRRTGSRRIEKPQSRDSIPEPPHIAYAAVARKGLPNLEDLPQPRPLPKPELVVSPKYEKLIRSAVGDKKPQVAEKYLQAMIIDFYAGVGKEAPNGCCYNMVLHSYATMGDAEKTEDILKLMWEDFERGNSSALPNTRCYTSCMYAWQKSKNKYHAPVACEKILAEMYKLHGSGEAPGCKPDLFAYTCILHCWADSKRDDAIDRAQALFQQMITRYSSGETDLLPDNVCYSNLINVYILSGPKNFSTIEKAESLFWDMVASFFDGNRKAAPTTRNFNTVLAAFSKLNEPSAAVHASDMVREWERFCKDGRLSAKPDAYSYSLLLKSWASSSHPEAVDNLLDTAKHLKILAMEGEGAACFDTIKYVTVISALAKHNEAQKAHDLLLEMISVRRKEAKLDLKIFHTVMAAWSRHQTDPRLAVDRVQYLLDRLWDIPKMKPDLNSFNLLLKCFKHSKQGWRANAVLTDMKRLAKQKEIEKPDENSYRAVLETWKLSNDTSKNIQIRALANEYKHRFGKQIPSLN